MLNMKKGLAIVLAAATAFTFAPVASLSSAVSAYAGTDFRQAQNVALTVDDVFTYDVNVTNVKDGTTFTVINSAPAVVRVDLDGTNDGSNVANAAGKPQTNGKSFSVKALAKGTAKVTIKYHESNGAELTKEINFTVSDKKDTPNWKIDSNPINEFGYKADGTTDGHTLKAGDADNNGTFTFTKLTTSNPDVVAVKATVESTNNEWKLTFKKAGTAKLTASVTGTASGKSGDYTITVNVIPNGSTFKIGDTEITTADAAPNVTAGSVNIKKTIYLTAAHSSENIGATLVNPQVKGEKISYTAYKADSNTDVTLADPADKTSEITVSDDGTVTATANALNATEGYYFVKAGVDDDADGNLDKIGWVRVITTRDAKAFSTLKVSIEGKDYEKSASYDAVGGIKDSTDTEVAVNLSTKDKTTVPFTVTSSNNYEVKSNDTSTVDVVNGALVAKRTGVAAITISTKSDVTHYGAVTITLKANVTNQMLNAKVVAADSAVALNKVTKSKKLAASVVTTPALAKQPTLSYRFVSKNSDGTYAAATPVDFTLKDGVVTYTTTNEASTIVEISAPATNDYTAPAPAYVTVTGTQKQQPTKLSVSTKSLNLEEGASDAIAATGTALSFKSSDEKVATVDATGKVTGVKEGVAVITVSDAGNDEFAAGSADVTVYVTAKAVKPAKVTGVKVSNKKGAKVSVSWTSQDKNINYRVYKKVGNGKWIAKNVTSNKATLSVKKGAKVTVKVKAFVKGTDGKTVWGPKATQAKAFKTDKK